MERGRRQPSYLGKADHTTRRYPHPALLIGKVKSSAAAYIQIEQGRLAFLLLSADEVGQIHFFFQSITLTG